MQLQKKPLELDLRQRTYKDLIEFVTDQVKT